MFITEKNLKVADEIVKVLIKENCTVKETEEILHAVARDVRATSTVQMEESYQERFKDDLEHQE